MGKKKNKKWFKDQLIKIMKINIIRILEQNMNYNWA